MSLVTLTLSPYILSLSIYTLGTLSVCLLVWVLVLEIRIKRFMRGAHKKNIEQHLAAIAHDYEDLTAYKKSLRSELDVIERRLSASIRGIGTVHFHPFAGSTSSKPSFAMALLSEQGDGFIISTLLTHNSASIFTKSVTRFIAEKELSEEEAKALEKAKISLHSTGVE